MNKDLPFMRKPCKNCPFRKDVTPYLHPERGEEIAYSAQNRFNSFHCHTTTEHADTDEGETIVTEKSKECAGFLTVMATELGEESVGYEGFEPAYSIVYDGASEMAEAYDRENR